MIDSKYVAELADEWRGKHNSYAEFIATIFKDKYVEIYVGDSYEDVKFEQTSQAYPAVFSGKVVAAYRECLVIDSIYVSKDKKARGGGLIFISERAIRCLSEVTPDYSIQDLMLRSNDTFAIYDAYKKQSEVKIKNNR